MRLKILFVMLMLVLIVIDFAAMDGITTEHDTSHATEYVTLLASVPLFCMISAALVGRELRQIAL